MPEQPEYCLLLTIVNEVPFIDEMVMFKPYFIIDNTSSSFDVVIKVPSDCYYIEDYQSATPAGGSCGVGEEYEYCIGINKEGSCPPGDPTLLTHTVYKSEDPEGMHMVIYTIDQANNDAVVGVSKTRRKLQGSS